jgi:hypothetical protein
MTAQIHLAIRSVSKVHEQCLRVGLKPMIMNSAMSSPMTVVPVATRGSRNRLLVDRALPDRSGHALVRPNSILDGVSYSVGQCRFLCPERLVPVAAILWAPAQAQDGSPRQ